MIELQYITTPVIGAVIGYITNDLAIKMLFRPHKAKYIFGIKLPFTPGLIPKEKARIAESIGIAISENLMSKDVLEKYFLSDELVDSIRMAIEHFIYVQKNNEQTVREFIGNYLSDNDITLISSDIERNLTIQVSRSLLNPSVGENVAHVVMEYISNRFKHGGATELLTSVNRFGGIASNLFGGNFVVNLWDILRKPTEKFLANQLNCMFQKNSEDIVGNILGQEMDAFLDKKLCVLLEGHDEQISKIVDTIETVYRMLIKDNLSSILEIVDISKIVRDRIGEMDVDETEKLILKVMNKELKSIVWLGALLGLVMGMINLLF